LRKFDADFGPATISIRAAALYRCGVSRGSREVKETILLVDDNEAVLTVLRRALERFGYVVLAASGGVEALEIIRGYAGPIHLLVTDVRMPGIGGPELASRIQFVIPGIRVLFLSGDSSSVSWPLAGTHLEMLLLEKPITAEELARKVREVLDR
jgi:two-component system cell cycle sensor histidine kinase/response regulator CckA